MRNKRHVALASLHQVADALGVPVERFLGGDAGPRAEATAELLRIWEGLPTEAARDKVLACARDAAAESDALAPAE